MPDLRPVCGVPVEDPGVPGGLGPGGGVVPHQAHQEGQGGAAWVGDCGGGEVKETGRTRRPLPMQIHQ